MSLLETYCITGFLFTMLFEYLFEINEDSEMKFTGLTERIMFFVLWPLILLIVIRKTLKKNNIFSRKELQIFLENNSIQTRPIFSGNILRHPAFENLNSKQNNLNTFKNADYIMRYGLLIGCHQGLSDKQINYIHEVIRKFFLKKI